MIDRKSYNNTNRDSYFRIRLKDNLLLVIVLLVFSQAYQRLLDSNFSQE